MGWYSALGCGSARSLENGFTVANTMGALMQRSLIAGQLIYSFVDDTWTPVLGKRNTTLSLIDNINLHNDHTLIFSIDLGGMLVLADNEVGLTAFEASVEPVQERFPMRLGNHAAFHTALQAPVAQQGRNQLLRELFSQPNVPLIDGRGTIWWPKACDSDTLWDYTLGEQVTQTYDFSRAIMIAAREFAPDYFIITGPGTTLGGAVAQSLIFAEWSGMQSKIDFQAQ